MYYDKHPEGCNCSEHHKPLITLSANTGVVREVWEAKGDKLNNTLFDNYNKNYQKGINNVFNKVSPKDELYDLSQQFRLNAANFAAHKAYKVTGELEAIKKATTNYSDYKSLSKPIIAKYDQYQKTEYNAMVARSRTAMQWDRFQGEKHLYPNLEWLPSRAAHPREEHIKYYGLILPMDDPFWQQNQPGNEWGCVCDWKTTDEDTTSQPEETYIPSEGLEGNPYETGELITENHSYFKNAPDWVERNSKLLADDDIVYSDIPTKKGSLQSHILTENDNDYKSKISISKSLLNKGIFNDIKLLPEINAKEVSLRERYYGIEYCKLHPEKCPDIKADDKILEIKEHSGSIRSLKERIKIAIGQSNIILIKINNLPDKAILDNIVMGAFNKYKSLERVIIFDKNNKIIIDEMTKANQH